MKLFLDTSVINDIAYDSNSNELLEKIIKNYEPRFSMLNVAEILTTPDASQRKNILNTAGTLSKGYYPLARPQDILKRSLEAFVMKAPSMDFSISDQDYGVWSVLINPDIVDDVVRSEAVSWKKQQEDWLQSAHESARPDLQDIIEQLSESEKKIIKNRASFLRHYVNNDPFLRDILKEIVKVTPYAKQYTGIELGILNLEPWRFYLSALAVNIFNRSIQPKGYKKRKNAGTIDTEQAVYLSATDVFVTSDIAQGRMMRLVNCFGLIKREVWNYRRLKSKLGLM